MAMTAPGHIEFAGESISVVRALIEGFFAKPATPPAEAKMLTIAMRTRYRDFGHFEAQVFAIERLRAHGEVALALIASLSLLEWLLNSCIGEQGKRKRNLA